MVKTDNTVSATAYLQSQKMLIGNLRIYDEECKTYQVPVTQIETLTNLDFGKLREYDPLSGIKDEGILDNGPDDIKL